MGRNKEKLLLFHFTVAVALIFNNCVLSDDATTNTMSNQSSVISTRQNRSVILYARPTPYYFYKSNLIHPMYQQAFYYRRPTFHHHDYFRAHYPTVNHYSSSPYHYSHGPLAPYYSDYDDHQRTFGALSNFLSSSGPIRDYINKLVLRNLLRIPGVKERMRYGEVCQSSADGEYGTCLGRPACARSGGQSGSPCGLGTFCCTGMTVAQCGAQIAVNNTYWTAPSSLDSVTDCGATLRLDGNLLRQGNGICQVRLDFVNFDLPAPASGTKCSGSQFQVSDTTNPVPDICGSNSQQHMYLHVSSATEIKLNFKLDGNNAPAWKVRISQIPCSSSYLAPSDCLQYYTESGNVTSFYSQNVPLSRWGRPRQLSFDSNEHQQEELPVEILNEEERNGERLRREIDDLFERFATDPTTTIDPTTTVPPETTTATDSPTTTAPSPEITTTDGPTTTAPPYTTNPPDITTTESPYTTIPPEITTTDVPTTTAPPVTTNPPEITTTDAPTTTESPYTTIPPEVTTTDGPTTTESPYTTNPPEVTTTDAPTTTAPPFTTIPPEITTTDGPTTTAPPFTTIPPEITTTDGPTTTAPPYTTIPPEITTTDGPTTTAPPFTTIPPEITTTDGPTTTAPPFTTIPPEITTTDGPTTTAPPYTTIPPEITTTDGPTTTAPPYTTIPPEITTTDGPTTTAPPYTTIPPEITTTDVPTTTAPPPPQTTTPTTTTTTAPSSTPKPTPTTPVPTTTTGRPTTEAPTNGGGYVYRKVKLGDQDVKICYKKS